MSFRRLVTHGRGPWALVLLIGVLFWAGCESGGYSGPTGTVSGTVTLNGQPVPQGCTVAFIADAGHTASGRVEAGGKYTLSVAGKSGKSSGVPVGNYKVCVTPPATAAETENYDEMMENAASGKEQAQEKEPAQQEIIPAAFQSTATSGLSFEVKQGPNTFDIKL